jgi:hypothetical protein
LLAPHLAHVLEAGHLAETAPTAVTTAPAAVGAAPTAVTAALITVMGKGCRGLSTSRMWQKPPQPLSRTCRYRGHSSHMCLQAAFGEGSGCLLLWGFRDAFQFLGFN